MKSFGTSYALNNQENNNNMLQFIREICSGSEKQLSSLTNDELMILAKSKSIECMSNAPLDQVFGYSRSFQRKIFPPCDINWLRWSYYSKSG